MKRAGLLFAALALVACGPQERADEEGVTGVDMGDVEPAEPPGEPVATLAGEWRVAGIDGAAIDYPHGIALSADETRIAWHPTCAGQFRDYRIEGKSITMQSPPRPPLPEGEPLPPPPPVCTIPVLPGVTDVMRAFDAAETIVRTPQNGIHISGGGHSVTLFSQ